MTTNMGALDRAIRVLIGLALIVAPWLDVPDIWGGTWGGPGLRSVSMVVGVVLAATALAGFCPLYRLLGVSTCAR